MVVKNHRTTSAHTLFSSSHSSSSGTSLSSSPSQSESETDESDQDETEYTEYKQYNDKKEDTHRLSMHKKYEKWMLPVINARRVLDSRNMGEKVWGELLSAIQALETSLKSNLTSLDIFTPVLARFILDLNRFITSASYNKEYRKKLKTTEAKACTVVQQKAQNLLKMWERIITLYELKPPPIDSSKETQVVNEIERLLMLSPHKTLSLRKMKLSQYPWHLRLMDCVASYYNSFSKTLDSSRWEPDFLSVLDLSKNNLTDLPPEILLFRNLVVLRISHNQFTSFPPYIIQIPKTTSLLGIELNPLRKANAHKVGINVQIQDIPYIPRLMDLCARNILVGKMPCKPPCLISRCSSSFESLSSFHYKHMNINSLAGHLVTNTVREYLRSGYLCELCGLFISSNSAAYLPEIIENISYIRYSDFLSLRTDRADRDFRGGGMVNITPTPLLRRFCGQCWKIHCKNEAPETCGCITCLTERREDGDVRWMRMPRDEQ
ncbi:10375_t:CDS:2 [Paraglomus brasilianum]|uniref:10375_t:CDS:1 n=1 Tax=Paraglomus brasilianum TaxID=144538 RepID=A0A9N9A822_9GLOM|nr:10375_t:CDS:2 [Paraglomus brasilianum]